MTVVDGWGGLRPIFITASIGLSLMFCGLSWAQPRLVLQITVDGLRGDLLDRYAGGLSKGGFNRLARNGVVYRNAHYLHANTETIVGHATLATGATPALHGMVGNVWYNVDTGELGYNIEDPAAPMLPTQATGAQGAQVDPAQNRSRSDGRSPRGILVPTFSDTLSIGTRGESKIYAISGKDRSAVAMAGQTGIAYWYSTDTGDFQTSSYYMTGYPEWVRDWNAQGKAKSHSGESWTLLKEPSDYMLADQDDRAYEVDLKGYGVTFPHPFGNADHPLFYTRLLVSAYGDRLLADFGKTLIQEEGIGQDDVTDYLSISFSSVDAVNHFFGPSSLENEDAVLSLDRTLEDLLAFIDAEIGMDKTIVVLSADHGMADMPEYASELGYDAGRVYDDEVLSFAKEISKENFAGRDFIKDFFRPYLYLDAAAIDDSGADQRVVAHVISEELRNLAGIGGAVPTNLPDELDRDLKADAIRHNHHRLRSGDIYVYQQPYWYLFTRGPVGVMHGSPWAYDTRVNIIFSGPGVEPARVDRLVHPIDVAPTLSALLGLSPPAASQGTVLSEVVPKR